MPDRGVIPTLSSNAAPMDVVEEDAVICGTSPPVGTPTTAPPSTPVDGPKFTCTALSNPKSNAKPEKVTIQYVRGSWHVTTTSGTLLFEQVNPAAKAFLANATGFEGFAIIPVKVNGIPVYKIGARLATPQNVFDLVCCGLRPFSWWRGMCATTRRTALRGNADIPFIKCSRQTAAWALPGAPRVPCISPEESPLVTWCMFVLR